MVVSEVDAIEAATRVVLKTCGLRLTMKGQAAALPPRPRPRPRLLLARQTAEWHHFDVVEAGSLGPKRALAVVRHCRWVWVLAPRLLEQELPLALELEQVPARVALHLLLEPEHRCGFPQPPLPLRPSPE